MGVILDQGTEPQGLRLEGEMEIGSAAELKSRLLEAVATGRPAQVSLEGMTALDVTTLQLLAAAQSAARARGAEWNRQGVVPESLSRTAAEAGWQRWPFAVDEE